jgi:hypothetical protein
LSDVAKLKIKLERISVNKNKRGSTRENNSVSQTVFYWQVENRKKKGFRLIKLKEVPQEKTTVFPEQYFIGK